MIILLKMSTLFHNLLKSSRRFPRRPLFHMDNGNTITYNSFLNSVHNASCYLNSRNVQKGDRIMIIGTNSPKWATLAYAAWKCGAVIVPTYPSQQRHIKQHIANETKPRLIFHEDYQRLTDDTEEIRYPNVPLCANHFTPQHIDYDDHDMACILYTSGTSGLPKGVRLTHNNIMSNLLSVERATVSNAVSEYDRYVSFLPWDHCYGLNCELNYIIMKGASTHIVQDLTKIRDDFQKYNPTVLCSVPKLFYMIHKNTQVMQYAPSFMNSFIKGRIFGNSIRFATSGGSATDPVLIDHFTKMGLDIYTGYGTTETSPMISLNTPDHNVKGSVGKVLDCNTVKLVEGEIHVRGSNLTSGYLGGPDDSFVSIDNKEWYNTGDKGYIKDDYMFITGRSKEQYKLSNGIFVNPVDIEQKLLTIPEIEQVMVYPDPSNKQNEAIIVTNSSYDTIKNKMLNIAHLIRAFEYPQKLIITKDPFTVANGSLTQKQSLIRKNILDMYRR